MAKKSESVRDVMNDYIPAPEKAHFYAVSQNASPDEREAWEAWYAEQRDPDQPALVNQALAALANPECGVMSYVRGRASESNRRQLQTDLVASQKFFVDDKLVRHCVEAGMDTPSNMVKMWQNAMPCFDLLGS